MFRLITTLRTRIMGNRSFLDRLVDYLVPSGLPPEEKAKRILICFLILIAVPVLCAFSVKHFQNRDYLLGFFLVSSAILMLASVLIGRQAKDVTNYYRINIAYLGIVFLYHVGTSAAYPNRLLWSYILPLESFYLLGRKEGLFYNGVYILAASVLISYQDFSPIIKDYSFELKMEYVTCLLVITLISYSLEAMRARYERGMKAKQLSLEQEVRHRSYMEKAAREALEEQKKTQAQLIQSSKLASIGELASGIAHELNQPLMVIRTICQLRQRNFQKTGPLPDKMMEDLTLLDSSTKRMMNIINHLRTFSRQAGSEFEPIAVNGAIKGCLLMVGEQLRLHNITVELDLAESLPTIMGNATQLEQVILNVIVNARDAIEDARLREDASGVIEVITRVDKSVRHQVEILIRDTGAGIPTGDLDKIFDPFFTTKEIGRGTGLGLSISYGIIKAHKGEIEVTDTGSGGTTFRIALPAMTRVDEIGSPPTPPQETRASS